MKLGVVYSYNRSLNLMSIPLSTQPMDRPFSYGTWLLLIAFLVVFNLLGPLNFLLNQLNSSNYLGGLLNQATVFDWILYACLTLLTPITLICFWYRKAITVPLLIVCLSISLLVNILESISVSHSSVFLQMQWERVYYNLFFKILSYLPAIVYLVRSKHAKKLFIK